MILIPYLPYDYSEVKIIYMTKRTLQSIFLLQYNCILRVIFKNDIR